MNHDELGRKIASRLDEGLGALPPRVARRLALARTQALARYSDVAHQAPEGPGGTLANRSSFAISPRLVAPVFGLVLALIVMFYWQQSQRLESNYADNADIDAQMLTDELPVTAYLDQGFEIWLYHQTPADGQQ